MKHFLFIVLMLLIVFVVNGQAKLWTEKDRLFLVDNLTRSRDELIMQTRNLSDTQWNFKESPERWSIRQVVEHINIWELLFQREVNLGYEGGPKPGSASGSLPDSLIFNYVKKNIPNIATEFTKPFTYSMPMGLIEGPTSVAWFLKMRNESLEFIKNAREDLRIYFGKPQVSIHFSYLCTYAHTDRHLKQIARIRSTISFPGK